MDLTKQFYEALNEAAKWAPSVIANDKKAVVWATIANAIASAGLVDAEKLETMMKSGGSEEADPAPAKEEKAALSPSSEQEKPAPVTGRAKLANAAAAKEIKSEASLPEKKEEPKQEESAHNASLQPQKPTLRRSVAKKEEPDPDAWTDEAKAAHKEDLDRIDMWKSNFGGEVLDECVEQFMQGAGKTVSDLTPRNIKPFCSYMNALIDDLKQEEEGAAASA